MNGRQEPTDTTDAVTYGQPPSWPGRPHSGFAPDGYAWPGRGGFASHVGPPLTPAQTAELADGAEVVITWFGGNGPHPYRVLVDQEGLRRVEGLYCDRIPAFQGDRITVGWTDAARAFFDGSPPWPDHILRRWAGLRGLNASEVRP